VTYDPTQPTPVDVIRAMARDTANVAEEEILQDEEYIAVLEQFGASWAIGAATDTAPFYRASAELLRQVATAIEQDPSSISAPKDGSIGYGNRTQTLRDKAKAMDAKADALDAAAESDIPIVSMFSVIVPGPTW